jgi:hypothetical protein
VKLTNVAEWNPRNTLKLANERAGTLRGRKTAEPNFNIRPSSTVQGLYVTVGKVVSDRVLMNVIGEINRLGGGIPEHLEFVAGFKQRGLVTEKTHDSDGLED